MRVSTKEWRRAPAGATGGSLHRQRQTGRGQAALLLGGASIITRFGAIIFRWIELKARQRSELQTITAEVKAVRADLAESIAKLTDGEGVRLAAEGRALEGAERAHGLTAQIEALTAERDELRRQCGGSGSGTNSPAAVSVAARAPVPIPALPHQAGSALPTRFGRPSARGASLRATGVRIFSPPYEGGAGGGSESAGVGMDPP